MIRTVVIDDEPYIRKSILCSIETANPDFQVIAEAGNGIQGYQKITELRPDVVFVDIRMPVMDGIALLEKLHQEGITPIRVILSGYSEFEYAKKAIQYDVFDYVLKPLHLEPFTKLLSDIADRIYTKRSGKEYEYLHSIFKGIKPSVSKKELELHMSRYLKYACFYLIAGSYMYAKNNQFNPVGAFPGKEQLLHDISDLYTPGDQVWGISGENPNEMLLIIGTETSAIIPVKRIASELYQRCEKWAVPVTLVFSPEEVGLAHLQEIMISLKYTAMQKICFGYSSLIEYQEKDSGTNHNFSMPDTKTDELLSSIREKRYQDFKNLVKSSMALFSKNQVSQQQLQVELIRILEMLRGQYLTAEIQEFVDESISNSLNYEKLTEVLLDYIDDYTKSYYKELSQDLADLIRDYIDLHFAESLTLSEIADYFHISPSYLSTVFKKSYAVSPNEYLMNKRISKATDLLAAFPPIPVKQIAEMTGYSDPFYFSRIFKMTTGKTPTEYRVHNINGTL